MARFKFDFCKKGKKPPPDLNQLLGIVIELENLFYNSNGEYDAFYKQYKEFTKAAWDMIHKYDAVHKSNSLIRYLKKIKRL